eukprot:CAMPEP_0194280806 /NCGR_PEP_ID=MMETSP0169-20130528/18896_1 /TAXON_ID=218684 /ORGANISM="Corethron pennatum, Strain L29A3" /LENGTH=68 /DNA_ID=CAMNT_0039025675 /DNA_START=144 /DNA_END=350 /DNA_ORIENTATION=-
MTTNDKTGTDQLSPLDTPNFEKVGSRESKIPNWASQDDESLGQMESMEIRSIVSSIQHESKIRPDDVE